MKLLRLDRFSQVNNYEKLKIKKNIDKFFAVFLRNIP